MKMYAVIKSCNEKQEIVDFRRTKDEAIIVCACWNTKRTSNDGICFVKEFEQPLFETTLDEKVNNVYKIKVLCKNCEIIKFVTIHYIFGEKNEIKEYHDNYGDCVTLVRTYDYREDEDKIKTQMYNDVCKYINMLKKSRKSLKTFTEVSE